MASNMYKYQEKIRGHKGRLPVQALRYVNSAKAILGIAENSGSAVEVHFLWGPHNTILWMIRLSTGKYPFSIEAPFKGILERVGISERVNKSGRYIFTTS